MMLITYYRQDSLIDLFDSFLKTEYHKQLLIVEAQDPQVIEKQARQCPL